MKIPVSVIIMTKNEENNIEKCLKSVEEFDEIFVVDSNSEDRTCDIAEKHDANVVNFTWNGEYPKKKQWCLENLNLTHEWVLYVDADEEVGGALSEEIRDKIEQNKNDFSGFFVGYDYVFLGKKLNYGHRVFKLVLFKKNEGKFLDYDDLGIKNMWEVEGHYQPKVNGRIDVLKNHMLHNDHDNLYHFYEKHNKYSDWEAVLRSAGKLRHAEQSSISSSRKLLQWCGDRVPLRGLIMFVYAYVLKLGFLDGRPGFYYALSLSIYHTLISMKIYEIKMNRVKCKE